MHIRRLIWTGTLMLLGVGLASWQCFGQVSQFPLKSPKARGAVKHFYEQTKVLGGQYSEAVNKARRELIGGLDAALKEAAAANELDDAIAIRDTIRQLEKLEIPTPAINVVDTEASASPRKPGSSKTSAFSPVGTWASPKYGYGFVFDKSGQAQYLTAQGVPDPEWPIKKWFMMDGALIILFEKNVNDAIFAYQEFTIIDASTMLRADKEKGDDVFKRRVR
jgi:hypothetical protein